MLGGGGGGGGTRNLKQDFIEINVTEERVRIKGKMIIAYTLFQGQVCIILM